MKVLVTGGAGFIGSHVADLYLSKGHRVVVVDNLNGGMRRNIPKRAKFVKVDIRDGKGIEKLFKAEKFEAVNSHAAQMSVPDSVKDPLFDAQVNVCGILNLLESGRRHGLKKFIHVSSGGTVYGTPKKLPALETYPILPESPYGISKAVGEDYLAFYQRQYGIQGTVLRYSNVYGPRQLPHGEAGVVAIFIQRLMAGKVPTIFGDGGVIRDYVYVGDVARASLLALKRGGGEAFNIGTGVPTTVKRLYQLVAAAMGNDQKAQHGPARPGDLRANWLSYAKAKRQLGWSPQVGLEEGIQNTVDYFIKGS